MYRFYCNTNAREREANKNARLKISKATHEVHIKPNASLLPYGRSKKYLFTYVFTLKKVQIEGHYNYKIKRRQQTVFTVQMRKNKNKMNVNEGQQWHKV